MPSHPLAPGTSSQQGNHSNCCKDPQGRGSTAIPRATLSLPLEHVTTVNESWHKLLSLRGQQQTHTRLPQETEQNLG